MGAHGEVTWSGTVTSQQHSNFFLEKDYTHSEEETEYQQKYLQLVSYGHVLLLGHGKIFVSFTCVKAQPLAS